MPITGFLFGQKRAKISNIVVDASVRESHENEAQITDNPVEEGVDVTDHVRIMPKRLTMDGVISDTPITLSVISNISGAIGTVTEFIGGRSLSQEAYDRLLRLQANREPMTIVTGLRVYQNMLIESLTVPRDSRTANAIHFTAVFREIHVARTRGIGGGFSLADSVSSLGLPNIDLGRQLSLDVPLSSPLAAGSSVRTFGSQLVSGSTGRFDVMNSLRGVF
jgi:hypothetical protein